MYRELTKLGAYAFESIKYRGKLPVNASGKANRTYDLAGLTGTSTQRHTTDRPIVHLVSRSRSRLKRGVDLSGVAGQFAV